MKYSRGNATLVLVLCLPLLVVLGILVVDIAHRVVTKMALQVAADRAAHAAAKELSEQMNTIAGKNWAIRQQFLALKEEMEATAMRQSAQEGHQKVRAVQRAIDDLREEMDALTAGGYRAACDAALASAARWAPNAALVPLYGGVQVAGAQCTDGMPLFSFGETAEMLDRVEPDDQWPDITYHWPEGGDGFPDPAREEAANEPVLQYRVKAARLDGVPTTVAFALRLEEPAPASVLPILFDDRPLLRAVAAAQPYGGSIKATAFRSADSEADAAAIEPYRPALIPFEEVEDDSTFSPDW